MWLDDPSHVRTFLSGFVLWPALHTIICKHWGTDLVNVRINMWGKQADLVKVGRPLSAVLIAISALLFTTAWTVARPLVNQVFLSAAFYHNR